ncbi:hypothetical protein RA27_02210 [Ruegeria sp. ANG-R]|uniref:hypothetical protein n=1 Tax=Ruegeria sp. ANG-R TaxID=1577903 RepID=UPI0005807CA8|nr:hypothetical protein [Ruegeria sp. ANG-R]KIC42226.1 hypothetical protein RA27_02210 [Ruegeria sp. ANG-R]
MDSTEQADGEKKVKQLLIKPLERRGLAKPSSLTKAQFEEMVQDLCARLAYMTEANLAALEEHAAGHPTGKDKDRFPIANRILEWAAQIQPPGDDASPLIRAVFANQLGRDALDSGWAPELLFELRQSRKWPGAWAVKGIKERAHDAVRRMEDIEYRLTRGDELTPTESDWRARRLSAIEKCRRIAQLGAQDGGKA